jgi:hypothetical protein
MRITKTLPIAVAALLALPAAAVAKDRNHDGLPDGWEKAHHLSLKVKQGHRDQDHDGLKNRGEFRAGTNPRRADTDKDGIKDGEENAGKVTSFENGVLTIALFDGSTLTGTVTPGTKVKCEGADDQQGDDDNTAKAARHGSDGDEPGDDHGEHRGDDNRGPNDNADEHATGCTIAANDTVQEAEVKVTSTGNVFREVELAK